jgi:antitoxin Phd
MSQVRPRRPVAFQGRRSESAPAIEIPATEAKNQFGRMLESAIRGGRVVITKHQSPKAVLISVDEFNALSDSRRDDIEALSEEFDSLLSRMQTPSARAGMKAAFNATPKQLGKAAAVAAARKRV